jgi:Zn-dependent protease with chaperone function
VSGTGTNAVLSDGRTVDLKPVRASLEGDLLALADADGVALPPWPIAALALIDVSGPDRAMRLTTVPGRMARLTIRDRPLAEALLARRPDLRRSGRIVSRGGLVAAAIAALAVAGIAVALPHVAPYAVALVPRGVEARIGDGVMRALLNFFPGEETVCVGEGSLPVLARLTGTLSQAAGLDAPPAVLVLRSRIENAFAVPGERIVVLSRLLERMESPDELAGVLAHEMGHVRERHGMQSLVEHVGLEAILSLAFGGGGVGNIGGGGGGLLIGLAYGRRLEREADRIGLETLRAAGLRTDGLVAFFARMEGTGGTGGFLSTHPDTAERRALFAEAGEGGDPALSEAEWHTLREICELTTPIEP